MWKLKPQPIKEAFAEKVGMLLREQRYNEIEARFFEKFVKGRHLTWQQFVFFKAIEAAISGKGQNRITIRSGHGIGKSSSLAMLIIWFLFCHYNAQSPCTAPTSQQIHDILWKELKVWLMKLPEDVQNCFDYQSAHLRMKDTPSTWFARASTASKENPEALAGVHGDYILSVADEASGIADEIFNTAEGSLTGKNYLYVLIGNPTRLSGFFYDTHTMLDLAVDWCRLHFNSEDSPIVSPDFIDKIRRKHGLDSDEYDIRVRGEFPRAEMVDDQGYSPLLNESDLHFYPRSKNVELVQPIYMGVDPSGEGSNYTSIFLRDKYFGFIAFRAAISNPMNIAHTIVQIAANYNVQPENIFVDIFGEGARVVQCLPNDFYVNGILPQLKPDTEEDAKFFLNLRSMGYWNLKNALRSGFSLADQKNWKTQLLAQKYRRMLGSGKIQLKPKRELKIESPDDADAASLTFMNTLELANMKEIEMKYKRDIELIERGSTGQ